MRLIFIISVFLVFFSFSCVSLLGSEPRLGSDPGTNSKKTEKKDNLPGKKDDLSDGNDGETEEESDFKDDLDDDGSDGGSSSDSEICPPKTPERSGHENSFFDPETLVDFNVPGLFGVDPEGLVDEEQDLSNVVGGFLSDLVSSFFALPGKQPSPTEVLFAGPESSSSSSTDPIGSLGESSSFSGSTVSEEKSYESCSSSFPESTSSSSGKNPSSSTDSSGSLRESSSSSDSSSEKSNSLSSDSTESSPSYSYLSIVNPCEIDHKEDPNFVYFFYVGDGQSAPREQVIDLRRRPGWGDCCENCCCCRYCSNSWIRWLGLLVGICNCCRWWTKDF